MPTRLLRAGGMQRGAEQALERDILTLQRALGEREGEGETEREGEGETEREGEGETEREGEGEAQGRAGLAERLEAALALNEEASRGWEALEAALLARLQRCREQLARTRAALQQRPAPRRAPAPAPAPDQELNYRQCGMPYFRDAENTTPQSNADIICMRNKDIVNIVLLKFGHGWARRDKAHFLTLMLEISKQKSRDKLFRQLDTLKQDKKIKMYDLEQQKQRIHDQLDLISAATILTSDICLDEQDYDWDSISRSLRMRHSAGECRAMWRLYIHPSLNSSAFTSEEHSTLATLVIKYKYQDWDRIAQELHTGRSGYQCFVYFKSVMDKTHICGNRWTPEEDDYLKRLVELCRSNGKIQWSRVAYHFGNRTKIQIYNRWATSVRPQIRKGRFIPEEDAVLLACINKFGVDFSKALQYLPGRILPQVRARYKKHIAQKTTASWSVEDDMKLLQLVENTYGVDSGKNFTDIVKHFPGKDRVSLRTRYLVLQRWMKKYPHMDLKYAPRRPPKLKRHVETLDLKCAVRNLLRALEVSTCKFDESDSVSLQLDKPSKGKKLNVDGLLINALMREKVRIKNNPRIEEDQIFNDPGKVQALKEYTSNLRRVMLLLGAQLDRQVFANSIFFAKFVHLLSKDEDGISSDQIKTYSKHNNVIHHFAGDGPNCVSIWKDTKHLEAKYVLPPNYNTITACKSLLLTLHKRTFKRYVGLDAFERQQYKIFFKRCQVLFFWPLLLSNCNPRPMLPLPLQKTDPSSSVVQPSQFYGKICDLLVTPYGKITKRKLRNNQRELINLPSMPANQPSKINLIEMEIIKPAIELDEKQPDNDCSKRAIKNSSGLKDVTDSSSTASVGEQAKNNCFKFSTGLKTYSKRLKKKDEKSLIIENGITDTILLLDERGESKEFIEL